MYIIYIIIQCVTIAVRILKQQRHHKNVQTPFYFCADWVKLSRFWRNMDRNETF